MSLADEIIIVSGLPRSGTSLMMQMLDQAGVPVVTDKIRSSDIDNPHGYYEFEPVKKTKQDSSWVPGARGKVVKMISALLYDLPATERYRVIFMQRNIDEILESQAKMLKRLNQNVASPELMKKNYAIHLDRLFQWLGSQSNMQQLFINYNQLLEDPVSETGKITRFLDNKVDHQQMIKAIDPALYRNRKSSPVS